MNFERLFKVYPEARDMSDSILTLMELVPLIDANLKCHSGVVAGVELDDEKVYGHRVVSTRDDKGLQYDILEFLSKRFPHALFLAEEKQVGVGSRSVHGLGPSSFAKHTLIFVVDPIDGSANYANGLWEWSTSIGVMKWGVHTGGIIYGPRVNGGMCILGERERGVFLVEEGGGLVSKVRVSSLKYKNVLFMGIDFAWQPSFNVFVNRAAKLVLGTKSIGSCALGLASVAAGKAIALVQPVQKPWDWSAGFPLVEEAGGKFQFYHYRDGSSIMLLDKPDDLAYISSNPDVGFIAGNPEMVRKLTDLLVQNYSI